MQIAPGIHRLGEKSIVNSYLVEESGEVTIIDAGVLGFYRDIPHELAAMGRTVADVRVILDPRGRRWPAPRTTGQWPPGSVQVLFSCS